MLRALEKINPNFYPAPVTLMSDDVGKTGNPDTLTGR